MTEYRYCPSCRLPYAVTRTGRMYRHKNPRDMARWCAGSGREPKR